MKVLLLLWVDASWHPVVVFTSQTFAEHGDYVDILSRRSDLACGIPGVADFGKNVTVHPIGLGRTGWRNQVDYLRFLVHALRFSNSVKPNVIIGYDMHGLLAAYLARLVSPQAKLIYHNLDLASKDLLSIHGWVVKMLEGMIARSTDKNIFSSLGRAVIFKDELQLKQKPIVVMNCQRLDTIENRTGDLLRLLHEKDLWLDRLVVRLGSIGPDHGIEATIQSTLKWKGNWGLVLAGVPVKSYLEKLQGLITSLNLGNKVLILPCVPYDLWYDCLYSADLGISLYEAGNVNHTHMAGAGNKLNLYLKAGIPTLVSNFPDFASFIEKYRAGRVVEASDADSIAAAVNDIFCNDEEYALMCRNARHAFETEFNFEKQFQPVLRWLKEESPEKHHSGAPSHSAT